MWTSHHIQDMERLFLRQMPNLHSCRKVCEFGAATIFGASEQARGRSSAFHSFAQAYPSYDLVDSKSQGIWKGSIFTPAKGTIDGYMLENWHDGTAHYDGLFVNSWTNSSQVPLTLAEPCHSVAEINASYHYEHSQRDSDQQFSSCHGLSFII